MAQAPAEPNNPPTWVRLTGSALGIGRLIVYFFVSVPVGSDAQWQLSYIPLWLADFPVSLVYFFVLPAPIGEAFVGPIWWAFLPYFLWAATLKFRNRKNAANAAET